MNGKAPGYRRAGGRMRVPLAGALWLAATATAQAAEWRYCYAFEEASRRFGMTAAFQTAEPMERTERDFRDFLARVGARDPRTACPLGPDRESVLALMRGAAAFNRAEGNAVVTLDWPAGDPVAAR